MRALSVCLFLLLPSFAWAAPAWNTADYCLGAPTSGTSTGACPSGMDNHVANSTGICWVFASRTTTQGSNTTVTSITDSKSLTWTKHKSFQDNAVLTNAYNDVEEWNTTAGALAAVDTATGDIVTVNTAAVTDHTAFICIAVSGTDSTIWDTNGSLGAHAGGATSAVPTVSGISTNSATTMTFGVSTSSSASSCTTQTAGVGFTLGETMCNGAGGTNYSSLAMELQSFTSAQSSLTVPMGTAMADWLMFADAICSGCSGGGPSGHPRVLGVLPTTIQPVERRR